MKTTKNERCDCGMIHADLVGQVRGTMLLDGEFTALADLYKMLGDSTRAKILWALTCAELCVCDLAVLLNMTKSAVSHALSRLRDTKLVKCDKRGKSAYYSLADEHVKMILDMAVAHIKE